MLHRFFVFDDGSPELILQDLKLIISTAEQDFHKLTVGIIACSLLIAAREVCKSSFSFAASRSISERGRRSYTGVTCQWTWAWLAASCSRSLASSSLIPCIASECLAPARQQQHQHPQLQIQRPLRQGFTCLLFGVQGPAPGCCCLSGGFSFLRSSCHLSTDLTCKDRRH